MKWSIFGLFSIGFLAAASAVVLVIAFQSKLTSELMPKTEESDAPEEIPELQVLVAAADLEHRTVVKSEDVAVKTVLATAAPAKAFTDPVQVVGKVLILPLLEGQAFLPTSFAEEGSGLHLATALDPGKRAVSVTLSDKMGMEELLYPGCMVDVLASLTADDDELGETPISITLLEEVAVLAIGKKTVVSPTAADEDRVTRGTRPQVTLLVEPEEAELLKLAMVEGNVSVVLRNPMDDASNATEGTKLSGLAPIFAQLEKRRREKLHHQQQKQMEELQRERQKQEYEMEKERYAIERARKEMEIARERYEKEKLEAQRAKEEKTKPKWQTIIVRGGEAETKTFERDEADREDQDQ